MYSKVEDRRLDVHFKLHVIHGDCVCGVLYFIHVIQMLFTTNILLFVL